MGIIDNFNEGLIIINNRRDTLLNANSSARKIYNAGLSFGSMNKMTDADLGKKKFKRADLETKKGLDKERGNESEFSIDLSADGPVPENPKISLVEIIDRLEVGEKPGTFVSEDVYRVCLPKKSRAGTVLNEAKENKTLITHVMFEAFLIEFDGETSIAVYLRDKTHYVKMLQAQKKNSKYKLQKGKTIRLNKRISKPQ